MTGRPKSRQKLASNRQLWRLNKLARLRLVDEGAVISSAEASEALDVEQAKLEGPYFPDTRLATRLEHAGQEPTAEASHGETPPGMP